MIAFTWKIKQLYTISALGDHSNVVTSVSWSCTGIDGDNASMISGNCRLPNPVDQFTPYDELTESQVIDWCWNNGAYKDGIESKIQEDISKKAAPKEVVSPLPWVQAPADPTPATDPAPSA